jgi:serine/threonine-protein kinase
LDSFFQLQAAVAGRYSLVRELGRGGMAIVFLARDVALDRLVAIKLLPPALATRADLRERFLREARTVAQLSHPNIVPIHAVEERDGLVFFVMSFVDGETLGQRVRRTGPLKSGDGVRILQEMAWSLAHAHARGVVHRDVKPDNVLLDGETGRAVVTDFGIAAAMGGSASGPGAALGTPQYLSPEQARGEEAGPRSDLYSLGVTAWLALAGRLPFESSSVPDLLRRHATEVPPPIMTVRPDLPPSLARAVDRCLAKRPEDRPASAEALAAELGASQALAPSIPGPVRHYLRKTQGSEMEVYAAVSAIAYLQAIVARTQTLFTGFDAEFLAIMSSIVGTAAAVVCGGLLVLRGRDIRALTRAGFDYAVVRRANAQQRAVAAADADTTRHPMRALALGLVGGAASLALGFWGIGADSFRPGFAGIVASTATFALTARAVRNALRPRIPGAEGRIMSWIERWLFRVAGVKNVPRAVVQGEPTILAIGGAIHDVWSALPAADREQLADLPRLAERLEAEAMRLRERPPDPASSERLRTVVAAMESLRLDLLRVASGAAEPGAVTAQLEAARRIGEDVDAMLAARDDAAALLRPETTPV